jgi:hypothetical protein
MMTVVPVAVPADAAQPVMGPDQPAARMVVIGIGVVRIIRVVATADKEVAMMVVGEAAMMEAAAVKGVEAAAMESAAVKASAMETATTGMKAASVEAAATMETASAMEATSAAMKTAASAAHLGHESVGCLLSRRHGLRCHE